MILDTMDNSNPTVSDRRSTTNVNGSVRRPSPVSAPFPGVVGLTGRPITLPDSPTSPHAHYHPTIKVIVSRDEKGYGMKVSGDNPVYVQSVKQGGAAEKAGLHAGDKIMEVNGVDVTSSTHTDVVALIRSSSQVVLTVQQRSGGIRNMGSPSHHPRPNTTVIPGRITGPQPVDTEKQYQLQLEREQYFRLMIEKEQRYIDTLRSQIATNPDEKKYLELEKTERNLQKLQGILYSQIKSQYEQQTSPINSPLDNIDSPPPLPRTPPPNSLPPKLKSQKSSNGNGSFTEEIPPPLPKRNRPDAQNNKNAQNVNRKVPNDVNSLFISEEINSNVLQRSPDTRERCFSLGHKSKVVDNSLYTDTSVPPPLPPRNPPLNSGGCDTDAANSINKQMSYPLVATCATIVNNYSPNTHHRTKSSPESLSNLSPAEASKRLINSESLNDLSRQESFDTMQTPPGTPPPPYPSPLPGRRQSNSNRNSSNTDDGDGTLHEESQAEINSPEISPSRIGRIFANSSPIHAATPQTAQQSIISPEDDEISDQETSHLDHGPFKSLSRLWEHTPHLAVFTNYILKSNADPNSLLFYLLTDLYKEGNAKEMRKWAFEIHSCFLTPGSPLRLCNVDENIAREIDDVLTREFDKEEILRKIFWKARNRAKEELTKQLDDFQQKRIRGLSTLYGGPPDSTLNDLVNNKAKEISMYESLFSEALEKLAEDFDKESTDPKRYYTASALGTVITRVFGVRTSWHPPERFPYFVNKERRPKFMGKYRKLNIQQHQYIAQHYYAVIHCNHCHQIVYGIGPQGYQCTVCLINLHRHCVKLYDDTCPGPINKKERSIQNFIMEKIRHEPKDQRERRKHSAHFISNFLVEKERRMAEEQRDDSLDSETGDAKPGHPVTRTGSDRRPDAVREESSKTQEHQNNTNDHTDEGVNSTVSLPDNTRHKRGSSNITRSESVKQQSEKRNKKRNISDPLHTTTQNEIVDLNQEGSQELLYTDSSASNSSLSSRSSDSPSTSIDAVQNISQHQTNSSVWDSDMEVEADPPDWQSSLTEEDKSRLHPHEKKRQDVINELFHTERTHVRNLKVLEHVFYQRIVASKTLKTEEIKLVFPNVRELLDIHKEFNKVMKNKRKDGPVVKEVGEIVANMFDGPMGENLQKAAATFCERQQLALEFIKERRKKDSRFESVLKDCETNKECRRLPLQGIIPTEMQRLSKYPLLLERLIDHVHKMSKHNAEMNEELAKLKLAHNRSKEILNHVNEAAKHAYNKARLEDIQRHLDTSQFERTEHPIVNEFRNLDVTRYKLLHEGGISLNRPNKTPLPVHLLILEEAVIILQREGEKYLLKFFHTGSQSSAPILRMANVLVRPNAAEKECLFLLNSNAASVQMYDLKARDPADMKRWFKHLSDAAEAYNRREGKSNRNRQEAPADAPEEETVQDLPTTRDAAERAETVGGTETSSSSGETESTARCESESSHRNSDITDEERDKRLSQSENDNKTITGNSEVGGGASVKLAADDWPLIHPSEMQVSVPPVHRAESVLTPLEKIKRKDEELRRALTDKEILVADFLSIPREDYHTIADMASESTDATEHDPVELALGAVFNSSKIIQAIGDSLNISEVDPVINTGGNFPSCTSNESVSAKKTTPPSVPVHSIKDIATTLNKQLSLLLSVVKQREEERDRLKKELHRTQEQLHEQLGLHAPQSMESTNETSALDCTQSGDLESIEESPTENENI